MNATFRIRTVEQTDVPLINDWARREGFAPGAGDVGIYRQTDRQGIWTGCLGGEPVGCIPRSTNEIEKMMKLEPTLFKEF